MKDIVVNVFDPASIDRAIEQINWLKARLAKLETYHERLAQLGVKVAQDAFTAIASRKSDYADIVVSYRLTENGFEITAQGEKVAYAEFGAGIYYNGIEPYGDAEIKRPADIDPIGQHYQDIPTSYGWTKDYKIVNYSKGMRKAWGYYTDPINKTGLVLTHGTPAVQGLYKADKAIHEEAVRIFDEVFRE